MRDINWTHRFVLVRNEDMKKPDDHKLKIISLHDAQAECTCKRWSLALTGEATKEEIEKEYSNHVKD